MSADSDQAHQFRGSTMCCLGPLATEITTPSYIFLKFTPIHADTIQYFAVPMMSDRGERTKDEMQHSNIVNRGST